MKEVEPIVMEKHELEYQDKLNKYHFFAFLDNKESDDKIIIHDFVNK